MRSRAYKVMLVGISLLTVLEQYASTLFLPKPIDGVITLVWRFVQAAAAWSFGSDCYAYFKARKQRWRAQQ